MFQNAFAPRSVGLMFFISKLRENRPPWSDTAPVRAELFGFERLEQHALTLAVDQTVTDHPTRVMSLHKRLSNNARALRTAYRDNAQDAAAGRPTVPAADWLLDNYHLVEAQIREIRIDLPPQYYQLLPKLETGPFAGYPRVFGLAWAFVAHTDSHFDAMALRRFLVAYQTVQPLTIGELWAVAITLRIVLIENLRRLTDQMACGRTQRQRADLLANQILCSGQTYRNLLPDPPDAKPMNELFAAQLAERLRNLDPRTTPAISWLQDRLTAQGASIDSVVRHAQERLGASNVTLRNVITGFRSLSSTDWNDLFEDVSLVEARLRQHQGYAAMDFASRNLYRSAIEELSRGSGRPETQLADMAVALAGEATPATPASDPGWHLIDRGRPALERAIGFRPPPRLWLRRLEKSAGLPGYLALIAVGTTALLAVLAWLMQGGVIWPWLVAMAMPLCGLAIALVDLMVARSIGAALLPGLELRQGVPSHLRTLVIVPVIMTDPEDLRRHLDGLEIHYLSGTGGDLTFALLTDGADAPSYRIPADVDLLALAARRIAALNERHAAGPAGPRFLHLHRDRQWNPHEGVWMGWERKRGKLVELNRLLRGATDTSFAPHAALPNDVRYVITLDADTRLPRDAAARLIGKMSHPLNQPQLDVTQGVVTAGYGILQPRVTPALGAGPTAYLRTTSGPGGMEPYVSAASDVYQDLFGQGSFTGKGIYDIDAFQAAMQGRIEPNSVLSHDLLEGVFARAGLASDIEVVEAFPPRHDLAAARQHRWTRGDWQLAGRIIDPATPVLGRVKIADSLRRSLMAPFALAALLLGWMTPHPGAATQLLLAMMALPVILPALLGMVPRRPAPDMPSHARQCLDDGRAALEQLALTVSFLPDTAWRMGDAILRTLWRLRISRRHLLEWTTAAQDQVGPKPDLGMLARRMSGGLVLTLGTAIAVALLAPDAVPLALPFVLLWLSAPLIARATGRALPPATKPLTPDAARHLRLTARRTWNYFETFVTARHSHLPPDNHQETPTPLTAARTSPTNVGLYLLACVAARDFGWISLRDAVTRLQQTLETVTQLEKLNGHLFNWYDTTDGSVLAPRYVSTVDSGNLAGHLIALAHTCEEWATDPAQDDRQGLLDTLELAHGWTDTALLDQIEAAIRAPRPEWAAIQRLTGKAARDCVWLAALHDRAVAYLADPDPDLSTPLHDLAMQARALAWDMDFTFLLDPERKLLSIGFNQSDNTRDESCYDLLASEARLASMFAIAKGDIPATHWFRLGRPAVPLRGGAVLGSWSGSMFEYLMPILVMDEPPGSLLDQSNRQSVVAQQRYGLRRGVPWGLSESGFNARDLQMNYQYSSFGVPELGLKRGLEASLVVAPYATALAAMVDPQAAARNLDRLAALGAMGTYGFYEALDFTPLHRPADEPVAVVHSHMAHHQGMTIVAIANVLQDGRMRHRFHAEPAIRAAELLLQERIPRNIPTVSDRVEASAARADILSQDMQRMAVIEGKTTGPAMTHILTNGRYSVTLTATGGGVSRWGPMAVTRWHGDPNRDDGGTRIWMRDLNTGRLTRIGGADPADHHRVELYEDRALFLRQDGRLSTKLEVLVSGEDDAEVRMLTLTSASRVPVALDLTCYAELVLTTPQADAAHPAFAKLFVQTEYMPEYGALIATRRTRSPDEPGIWAAHFAVVEATQETPMQYETDRAAFLGRDNDLRHAAALEPGATLQGGIGTVLDPAFALRHRIIIAPGEAARLAFWTVVADTRAGLIDLIDRHHDRNAVDRARTLAWTQAQVQLRHLGITTTQAAAFQAMTAPIMHPDARFRAPANDAATGKQSVLWSQGISGDLPIVLLRIGDQADMAQVHQLLLAQEYWRMKRLPVDVVILNEHPASYVQDLQSAVESALRGARPRALADAPGGQVHALRRDLLPPEVTDLLLATARVVLVARHGPLADQVAAFATRPTPAMPMTRPPQHPPPAGDAAAGLAETLEFFNGTGGFADDGREYVTILEQGRATPAPWINVIANDGFGFHVSATGAGCTWAENSRENRLTPWSNDPVTDPATEAFLIRDDESGAFYSPTARPLRATGRHVARHGMGYSRFEHQAGGLAMDLLQFVPLDAPVRLSQLTLRNLGTQPRRLTVITYARPVMGVTESTSTPFVVTARDDETGALMARNPWNVAFPDRVVFADLMGVQTAISGDGAAFLGSDGDLSAPAARLMGRLGAGLEPCMALECPVVLVPGKSVQVGHMLGQAASTAAARALINRMRAIDPADLLEQVRAHWQTITNTIQIKTPDRALDIMVNGWLPYQTLACRIQARAAFYQASGAYGFRDQLQDGMAMTLAQPVRVRDHLLRAAARQFPQGDVQHWWLPHSGAGVRTRISDDCVWLAYAVADYVGVTGDLAVLDQDLPFLEGPPLKTGQHDAFFQPDISATRATLWGHVALGLDRAIAFSGTLGLPLIGTGDWNDGMNRVGQDGRGESVWLGWLLLNTLHRMAHLADTRDPAAATRWRAHAGILKQAQEANSWDGAWYRRATFDDGSWLGSASSSAGRIDSIAQSWAVLSDAADLERAALSMQSLQEQLVIPDPGLILLFTPPFDGTDAGNDPGYIAGYPPGLRENGGQYSHAAMWAIMAHARTGNGTEATRLLTMVNPINHALTPDDTARYRVEPYVVAADVYSVAPHLGRGGWTWYTGSSAWMYRAATEGILGIRRQAGHIVIAPCLTDDWPGFSARLRIGGTDIAVTLRRDAMQGGPDVRVCAFVALDGGHHDVTLVLPVSPRATM
ncbi:GH36-type glycosyl hydrolase domain-containing protein [Paracoccus sp. C2R09]|uniref:GH36-type glycosyl hydrolase domain-containing protein n=2 Tax=unclassified Paracoccus (in: a-proteobacteria) TaxID=2688777 RepID=UPI0020915E3B|nr:glucoamylase family protein [Paracoccus sp. C2R09]